MRYFFILVLMLCSYSSFADEIQEIKVPTAEDGVVLAKFNKTTRMPVGASDERAEVTGVLLSIFTGNPLEWTWTYLVRFKTDIAPTHIRIEDESQRPNLLEVENAAPILKESTWVGEAQHQPLTKDVFDYMQSKGNWFYMRKFIIEFADGKKSVLHQPVIYSQAARIEILKKAMNPTN